MSTRSRIAIENQNGSVTSVYCHFDGYISGVGKTLEKHYTDRSVVEGLIELGDISTLGESTEDTVAYCRDRGEPFDQQTNQSVPNLFNCIYQSGEEFIYCFTKDGIWLVSDGGSVVDLKVAIEEGI